VNTITAPRRRPRVRSTNFKTLGWLIRREAAWRILIHYTDADRGPSWGRTKFGTLDTPTADREARRRMRHDPATRFYP